MSGYDALILVSFGGPEGPEDVIPFLQNVTRGRQIPAERLEDVARNYQQLGGISPLNAANRSIIERLESRLAGEGVELPVYFGNRNWHPLLGDTVALMRDDGIQRALALVTSAFSSYPGCRQYLEDISEARAEAGPDAPEIDKIRIFHNHPLFVEAQTRVTESALEQAPEPRRLVFSAHSIPTSMAASCDYEAQLRDTATCVADAVGEPAWDLAFQSRSGRPQDPWLEPDISDHIDALAAEGVSTVVVVPLGFLSEHVEIVWDLDVVAAERAHAAGVEMIRAAAVDSRPELIDAFAALVMERLNPDSDRPAVGALEVRPDVCAPDCCPPTTP